MNMIGQLLDEREDPDRRKANDLDDKKGAEAWSMAGQTPEQRLIRFDSWMRKELGARLDWQWAGARKQERIEQCRIYLERLVLEMWKRGWMLDGKRLAAHLTKVLINIGAYQRAGKVQDFWAYFQASVNRYVGGNAEEIREEAMRAGTHVTQLLGLMGRNAKKDPSLPELLAQRADEVTKAQAVSLRQKLNRERARQAAWQGRCRPAIVAAMKDQFEVFADRFFVRLRQLEIAQLDDAAPDVVEELVAKKKLLAEMARLEFGSEITEPSGNTEGKR